MKPSDHKRLAGLRGIVPGKSVSTLSLSFFTDMWDNGILEPRPSPRKKLAARLEYGGFFLLNNMNSFLSRVAKSRKGERIQMPNEGIEEPILLSFRTRPE